jgi:hypothetical protein
MKDTSSRNAMKNEPNPGVFTVTWICDVTVTATTLALHGIAPIAHDTGYYFSEDCIDRDTGRAEVRTASRHVPQVAG